MQLEGTVCIQATATELLHSDMIKGSKFYTSSVLGHVCDFFKAKVVIALVRSS